MAFEKQIELFGQRYLLIGNLEEGGTIATREQYEEFECSFAYLQPNGDIMRFNEKIGTRKDIKVLNVEVDTDIKAEFGKVLDTIANYPTGWSAPKKITSGSTRRQKTGASYPNR